MSTHTQCKSAYNCKKCCYCVVPHIFDTNFFMRPSSHDIMQNRLKFQEKSSPESGDAASIRYAYSYSMQKCK